MNARRLLGIVLSTIVILSFVAGCQAVPQTVEVTKEVQVPVEVTRQVEVEKIVEVPVEVTAAPTGPGVFAGAYPYTTPPVGHFNPFAPSDAITIGIYRVLYQPPLAMYFWADGTWMPLLATHMAVADG